MTKLQIKTKTEKDVLVEYQTIYEFDNADLMDLFKVSRQQAWNYLTGRQMPATDRLFQVAKDHAGEWEGNLAVDLLKVRGIDLKAVTA
jgi:hypothetical protein